MSLTRFWMRASELLYFGPPASAPAGEAHGGETLFPPPLSTFQGMVRTRLLESASEPLDLSGRSQGRIEALVGTPDRLPVGWQLEGPIPLEWRRGTEVAPTPMLWFRTPRFLFGQEGRADPLPARILEDWSKSSQDSDRNRLGCLNDLGGGTESPDPPYLLGLNRQAKAKHGPLSGWLSHENLLWALSGGGQWQSGEFDRTLPPFVKWEKRTGIALEKESGTARDGMLYTQRAVRFAEGSGLCGWLDASLTPPLRAEGLQEGFIGSGKKGRPLSLERFPLASISWRELWEGRYLRAEQLKERLPEAAQNPLWAWLVLLSPVRLEDPRRPALRLPASPTRVHVRGALLGDLETFGGFDIASGEVRHNEQLVPAGSCWLLELEGGSLEDKSRALRALHATHPLGDLERSCFGYGLTVVGLAEALWRQS